jgi:DNA polymerase-3 subunit epsilon
MNLDIVLIVDTETTGLLHERDTCIEVGCVEYSLNYLSVLGCFSAVIACDADNSEASKINHIHPDLMQAAYGREAAAVWRAMESMGRRADAALAHNSDFDKGWVPTDHLIAQLPWIDTCYGVDWPLQSKKSGTLINLALEHGLGVVDPHRALSDCLLIARLLTRCGELGHDVHAMLDRGLRPMKTFKALVSYEQRESAKEAQFRWQPKQKIWTRKMAVEDAQSLPFRVEAIEK